MKDTEYYSDIIHIDDNETQSRAEERKRVRISDDRIKHILGVARFMYDFVMKNMSDVLPNEDERTVFAEEMFTVGMLHDIGYEFVDNPSDHEAQGGNLLGSLDFKYWKAIRDHGNPEINMSDSPVLKLLNYADMHIGPQGQYMTLQERVDEVGERAGKDSIKYKRVVEMQKALMQLYPCGR